jgi:predicted enzyme related to lactoylglutathione lyase
MQLLNSFYGSVFDWKIDPIMEEYSLVTTGSGIVGASAGWEQRGGM